MPPDKWLSMDLQEPTGHSAQLRRGMADTLLLIVERGTHAGLNCSITPSVYVEQLVHGLPGLNDDWRMLASLRDQYRG